jgi:CMP-N,N'-diacetyllegionaminic acid synthase
MFVFMHLWYEKENGKIDGLMLLQPTSPFRSRKSVLQGIELFGSHQYRSVIGVSPAESHPMWCFKIEKGMMHPFIDGDGLQMQSQNLPPAYVVNGAFYLISPKELRTQRSFYKGNMIPLVKDGNEGLDIDREQGWIIAEAILPLYSTEKANPQ